MSGNLIRKICRRQVFTKTWSFESSALVCFHVTQPYIKTDFTLELKMVSLVWLQGGKDMSSISNPGVDVLLSASCLADNAS